MAVRRRTWFDKARRGRQPSDCFPRFLLLSRRIGRSVIHFVPAAGPTWVVTPLCQQQHERLKPFIDDKDKPISLNILTEAFHKYKALQSPNNSQGDELTFSTLVEEADVIYPEQEFTSVHFQTLQGKT